MPRAWLSYLSRLILLGNGAAGIFLMVATWIPSYAAAARRTKTSMNPGEEDLAPRRDGQGEEDEQEEEVDQEALIKDFRRFCIVYPYSKF